MPSAYKGTEPYIFISYAHKDSGIILPLIETMQEKGYRIWFDEGIEAGTEWSNNIAAHLQDCAVFVVFASHNSVKSENCLDEIAFAKAHQKPSLLIFLQENVVLPSGTDMQTARFQRMFYNRHTSDESFIQKLTEAPLLDNCREIPAKQEKVAAEPIPREEIHAKPEVTETRKDKPVEDTIEETGDQEKKRSSPGRVILPISILLELSYCLLGPRAMEQILMWTSNGWLRILLMVIPHTLIAMIIKLIVVKNAEKLTDDQRMNIFGFSLFSWLIASVLAVIIGAFYVPLDMNGFLKFLLSLGLNIIPAIVSVVIYFTITDGSAKKHRK